MRVAIVTPVFPPYRGGIGTVAVHDAECLEKLGVTVDVFTPKYGKKAVEKDAQNIHRLKPFYAWGNGAVLPALLSKLKDFSIIHLHYPFFGSDILAAFAAKMFRIPLVVTYHMRPKASGILGLTFTVYRTVLQPLIFKTASCIFVSSQDYATEHHVAHPHLIVHPFGVDTKRFTPGDQSSAREHFGLAKDISTIIFVGGLDDAHYFKGVDVLLAACSQMTTPYQLLIIGDGKKRSTFEYLSTTLDIRDHVHFAGSVPFEDLPRAYQAADVHVLPSIDRSEAFGLVTLEAMATGIPSIVSNLPGVRSLIVEGETGSVVPPNDAKALATELNRYCANLSFAKTRGENARRRCCAQYDDSVLATQLLEVYKGLSYCEKSEAI